MQTSTEPDHERRTRGWTGWRNRLLSSPAFQRWAAAFPLTRPVARYHARDLFDLTAGFVYSQIAYALVRSELLEALRTSTLSAAEAAQRASLPLDGAVRLLRAAGALGLTQEGPGGWTLGVRGAALAGSPGVVEMIAHHRLLYQDLADPFALLRGERESQLAGLWAYGADHEAAAAYSGLMAASQPMVAAQALAAYRFGRHDALLDVGGGEGAFVEAIAASAPRLRLGLFDLPAVVAGAETRLSKLAGRTRFHSGDFRRDQLPGGYDLISLVRVLHDHDDEPAAALLRGIYEALPAGGTLLMVEPMANMRGAERVGHAYFGMYLLAMGSGRPRSPAEIGAMTRQAGFRSSKLLRNPLPLAASVIVARK
ncbi:MAG TPA: methyltransferase [Allosphingosinicella sp.]|jgi:demethylspheroidene O-methyltransferase